MVWGKFRVRVLFLFFLLVSCGGAPQERNADLSVTYEGNLVHYVSSYYKTFDETTTLSEQKTVKYIIFSSDSCGSCEFLRKALKQSGHISKVHPLNVEDRWVQHVAHDLGVDEVPTMLVVGKGNNVVKRLLGPSDIVMYLLINVKL